MPFPTGSFSFRRFKIVGDVPNVPTQDTLDKLAGNVLARADGMPPEEVEYGWSGGQHVLDNAFTFDGNVFGETLHFALRLDTNKVPAELVRAWTMEEEKAVAAGNPSGFISKNQRRDVKESVRLKKQEAQRTGKYLKTKLHPVLWDMTRGVIYSGVNGGNLEKLCELFERTFGADLHPASAGSIGLALAESRGQRRKFEDLRPTRFVVGPEGESVHPEYPWIAKGPEPKDFLGNEFLLWLWHQADARSGVIATEKAGQVTVYFDRALDLECAYGQMGKDSIRGDGPSRQEESRVAVKLGKVPRKAGLVIDAGQLQYTLKLDGEKLAMAGVKLPDVEEAESPRDMFMERITLISDLSAAIDGLFAAFLAERLETSWATGVNAIRRWAGSVPAQAELATV